MPTPQNANTVRNGQTAEQNYSEISYGNEHGRISFGHIHSDGATTSSVGLLGSDGRHHIILDRKGGREGATQIVGPGRLSIKHGHDLSEPEDCIVINAVNGNVDIIASNGKLRLQGSDIELVAIGEGGSKGNITLKSESGNIRLDGKTVDIKAKSSYRIVTSGKAKIVANSQMEIYSSIIRGVTDACAVKDSKVGGKRIVEENTRR